MEAHSFRKSSYSSVHAVGEVVLHEALVVDLDLGDHVAGHVSALTLAVLAPVEPVRVLLPQDLNKARNVFELLMLLVSHELQTLMSCPSLKASSSSQASGLGDMVGGS